MSKISEKKILANRANSARSSGPKSLRGKRESRQNALKNGLFAKNIVVTAAGERIADFERFTEWVWNSVDPDGAVEATVTDDYVCNWWRRQRVRRCESADIQGRIENPQIHDSYLGSDEVEALKLHFCLVLEQYQSAKSKPSGDLSEIVTELENVRSRLASTPLGIEFLIHKVNAIKIEAESTGHISDASVAALRACAGLTDDFGLLYNAINWISKTESAKAAERARAGQPDGTGQTNEVELDDQGGGEKEAGKRNAADAKFMLLSLIEIIVGQLNTRKQVIETIGKWQDKTLLAAAVFFTDGTADRFARAETTYDRRMYRALEALLAMKQTKMLSARGRKRKAARD